MLDPREHLAQWLDGVDLDQPVAELIEPEWLEDVTIELDELAYLEEQARECAQELFEQGMIADLPAMDMPEQLLEQNKDSKLDFGR